MTQQQGFFMVQTTCPHCRGAGRVVEAYCETCEGRGTTGQERTLSVNIPAGVDTGVRMRLSGEGEAAAEGGQRGDLYVVINVVEHELFQREGADVHSEHAISFVEASLGAKLKVKTVHGEETVKLPAGTQPGTVVCLRRKGITKLNRHGTGDHYVMMRVEVPTKLSKKQKAAIEALAQSGL